MQANVRPIRGPRPEKAAVVPVPRVGIGDVASCVRSSVPVALAGSHVCFPRSPVTTMRCSSVLLLLSTSSLLAQGSAELSATDWSCMRDAYEAGRHRVVAVAGGHAARNHGQSLALRFDGRGFVARPDRGDWSWGLQLVQFGCAGHEHVVADPLRVGAAGRRLTYGWHDLLDEWYENGPAGLEHGYTVHGRPPGDGALTFLVRVRGDLEPLVDGEGHDVAFRRHGSTVLTYSGLHVFDASGRTLPARFEPRPHALLLTVDADDARYPITIDPVAQQAYLKASNTDAGDQFGVSVAVWGDTVVVGAPAEDGGAVGVNGNQADNSAADAGAAYVFVRAGGTWSQQAYLKASNTEAGDEFGHSVAIMGDTIVVGAWREDSDATGVDGSQFASGAIDSGAAYVFVRSGGAWAQQAYLKASNTGTGDRFGRSVGISGDTIVVGANLEDSGATGIDGNEMDDSASNAGAAYVFDRSGGTWSQQAYLKASNTETADLFGLPVAISGDTIVVGASWEDSGATGVDGNDADNSAVNSGAAYVFVRAGGTWSQQAYLKASNTDASDWFGRGVAVSGDTVVVGAYFEDSDATGVDGDEADDSLVNAGAAYVFVRAGATWSQQAYLKASNTESADSFGWCVAVSGDTVVVGAFGEDSNAVGVDGDQADNSAAASGAAYVFVRTGSAWSQLAYLKASAGDASDFFADAVAVHGDTVLVGASREGSNATGVDGDDTNDSAALAGAAYVFDLRSGGVGSNGRPALWPAHAPQIGATYTLDIENLDPTYNVAVLVFGFTRLPLPGVDLGPILGMTGCTAYQTADVLMGVPTGVGGAAQWSWTVAGSPGDTFWCQALCLDPPANAFGFTLSNAIEITLVP
jgi:hypothetical protein